MPHLAHVISDRISVFSTGALLSPPQWFLLNQAIPILLLGKCRIVRKLPDLDRVGKIPGVVSENNQDYSSIGEAREETSKHMRVHVVSEQNALVGGPRYRVELLKNKI